MNYRIRYRQAGRPDDAEAMVEANSPTEALVKFRCTRDPLPRTMPQADQVTSVSVADGPESGW